MRTFALKKRATCYDEDDRKRDVLKHVEQSKCPSLTMEQVMALLTVMISSVERNSKQRCRPKYTCLLTRTCLFRQPLQTLSKTGSAGSWNACTCWPSFHHLLLIHSLAFTPHHRIAPPDPKLGSCSLIPARAHVDLPR